MTSILCFWQLWRHSYPIYYVILTLFSQSLENGTIAVPLYSDPNENNADWVRANFNEIQQKNIEYVKNYIAELLQKHFKTLQM